MYELLRGSGVKHRGTNEAMMTRTAMHPLKTLAVLGAALLMWGLLFAYASSPAQAATLTVNSLADGAPANDGRCTLREAITNANDQSGSTDCAAGSGGDVIQVGVTGTVNLTGALPELSGNLQIEGPGADRFTVRRDTGGDYRIFTVTSGSVVSISGITISGGNAPNSTGGGIFNDAGTLTISGSTISGNSSLTGGGIHNREGILTVSGSTISGNSATRVGGGVFSDTFLSTTQKTTITNSTISGNSATSVGGGVYNFAGLSVIEHSTITGNTAPGGQGSGVASFGAPDTRTEVLSTIISANTNTDVDFTDAPTNSFLSKGYNLIGDGNATGAFNQTGDQTGVTDPGLGALSNNGGPTQTHALLSGSPAINAIPQGTNGCGTTITEDQRGVSRPQGSACDIGSFELEESDNEAPKVASTFPRGGGELGPAANIRATFSENMQSASVMNAFKLFRKGSTNQISAQVSYDAATDTATLNPTNNLRRGVTYKAVVTTVAKDLAGNRLDQNSTKSGLQQKVWFFEIDN